MSAAGGLVPWCHSAGLGWCPGVTQLSWASGRPPLVKAHAGSGSSSSPLSHRLTVVPPRLAASRGVVVLVQRWVATSQVAAAAAGEADRGAAAAGAWEGGQYQQVHVTEAQHQQVHVTEGQQQQVHVKERQQQQVHVKEGQQQQVHGEEGRQYLLLGRQWWGAAMGGQLVGGWPRG